MIATNTAALSLSVAKGLVKFAGRLDRLLAENVALRSPMALTLPPVNFSAMPDAILPRLQHYLARTTPTAPGPLGKKERGALAALLPPHYVFDADDLAALRRFYVLAFPDEAVAQAVSPDAAFLKYLQAALPSARASLPGAPTDADPEKQANLQAAALVSAFYVEAGADNRQLGYPVRIGLLVVDVLAEFGSENTALFVRDARLRAVVQSVLEHFAQPDLESFDAWSPFLRHALNATLTGAFDTRASWQGDNRWLGVALGALAAAREAAGDDGDNFLLGLVQGEGYAAFVSEALARSAGLLSEKDASSLQKITAEVLTVAIPLVAGDREDFGAFFSDRWTDLVQAAFLSLEQHGSTLLEKQSPVVRDVLVGMVKTFARAEHAGKASLLSADTVSALAAAAIGAVKTHPEIWANAAAGNTWVGQLISSALQTVSDPAVQATFSADGLATILRNATVKIAEHPEWLVQDNAVLQNVTGTLLKQLAALDTSSATTIADTAISAALEAITARPELIGTKYSATIAAFTGVMVTKVKDRTLTAVQARDLIAAAAAAVLLNPVLFTDPSAKVAIAVTNAVLRAAKNDPGKLVSGAMLVPVVQEVLASMARTGAALAAPAVMAVLEEKLGGVLVAGLVAARREMGQQLDLPSLPAVLGALVAAWARGKIAAVEANDPAFKLLFIALAERVSAVRAPLSLV